VALDLGRAAAEHEVLRAIADDIALDYARAARRAATAKSWAIAT
jgi:hypothetical protein